MIEAMKQALEALDIGLEYAESELYENRRRYEGYMHLAPDDQAYVNQIKEAITSLRQAIEQADKQRPVAFNAGVPPLYPEMKDGETISVEYTTPPTAPVREPVAYTTGHCKEKAQPNGCQLHNLHCGYPACDRKAVAAPKPQREWVGLTDEEIDQGLLRSDYALQTAHAWRAGVVFAMTQLKEKNT